MKSFARNTSKTAFRFLRSCLTLSRWEAAIAMKLLVGTAILCMLATAPVYAQQTQDNKEQEAPKPPDRGDKTEGKPTREPAKKPPEKPIDKPSKPPKEAPVKTEPASRHQQDQQQKTEQKTQQKQAKDQEKDQQKRQQQMEHQQARNQRPDQNHNQGHPEAANNGPRGNEGGHRIPEDRYRANFGRAHTFHVRYDNNHRFQFGGFWFQYTDAWPSDWGPDDDFYIVEIDGVDYLCDARFPDQRIVVIIAS